MQFISLSFFFAATALLSASGSIAKDAVEGSYGCSNGTCWASCYIDKKDEPAIDETTVWEDGGDWCDQLTMQNEVWLEIQCSEDSECTSVSGASCDYADGSCLS